MRTIKAIRPEAKAEAQSTIEKIATELLGIETLENRYSDSLDFHDCHVVGIADALLSAYEAGMAAASK